MFSKKVSMPYPSVVTDICLYFQFIVESYCTVHLRSHVHIETQADAENVTCMRGVSIMR
jgi:hypothetical protein